MAEHGSFQTIQPTRYHLQPFIVMLVSGYLGLMTGVFGVMGGCVLVNGEVTSAFASNAHWVRALGYALSWLWVAQPFVALACLVWVFVGASSRQMRVAAAITLASAAPYALLMVFPLHLTEGTSACGPAP